MGIAFCYVGSSTILERVIRHAQTRMVPGALKIERRQCMTGIYATPELVPGTTVCPVHHVNQGDINSDVEQRNDIFT